MPPESPRQPLPFEPRQNKKKTVKKEPIKTANQSTKAEAVKTPVASQTSKAKSQQRDRRRAVDDADLSTIPEVVSKRMIRRMLAFCGVPTALGLSSFVISYFIVINEIMELPSIAVLLVSLGFFGLGVLGLSYGILSTSWDEDRVGSLLGGEEFSTNLGRMVQAWKEGRQEARSKS